MTAGAVHARETCVLPRAPDTEVGAPGAAIGVTTALAEVHVPVPAALTAATRNTYDVPFVSPVTV